MAKEEDVVSVKISDLKELLLSAKGSSNDALITKGFEQLAAAITAQAAAIAESRVPYKSPQQIEMEKESKKSFKQIRENEQRAKELSYQYCSHLQGSNSNSVQAGTLSCFILHTLDTGERIGLCSNCGFRLSSLNPEHARFFAMKHANHESFAGRRTIFNPLTAQLARLDEAEKTNILKKNNMTTGV